MLLVKSQGNVSGKIQQHEMREMIDTVGSFLVNIDRDVVRVTLSDRFDIANAITVAHRYNTFGC